MKRFSIVLTILLFFSCKGFSQDTKTEVYSLPWTNSKNEKMNEARKKLVPCLSNDNLVFKGGLVLYSRSNKTNKYDFGGLSTLHCFDNGRTIMTVSDYSLEEKLAKQTQFKSKWFQFTLEYDDEQTLVGAIGMEKGQVHDSNGIINGEIESIASIGDSTLFISFDNKGEIYKYNFNKGLFNKLESQSGIDGFEEHHKSNKKVNENAGIEALTIINDSNLLAIYEYRVFKEMYNNAWLINPLKKRVDSVLKYYSFPDVQIIEKETDYRNYTVKGATTLSNGDIVIIEKIFKNDSADLRLVLVKAEDIIRDKIIPKVTLLETGFSKALDNFEGIDSYTVNGNDYLLLISDDNGDWNGKKQETLLLNFKLLSTPADKFSQ